MTSLSQQHRRRFFNIYPDEWPIVRLSLLHSFSYGMARVFAYTAIISLFLERFSAGLLPVAYIAAAGVVIGSGLFLTNIEGRVSTRHLFLGILGVLATTAVIFYLILQTTAASWLLFTLLVWFRLFFILTGFTFWGMTNHIFTIQQGKRLFGIIGTGEMLALSLGFGIVPLLVRWIGVNNLLLLAALFVSCSFGLTALTLSRFDQMEKRPFATATPIFRSRLQFKTLTQDHFLQSMFIIGIIVFLSYFLIDFSFFSQVRAQYQNADDLAQFIGYFYMAIYALGIVVRGSLLAPFLQKYGVRIGISLLPATIIGLALLYFLGIAFQLPAFVLGVVLILKFLDDLLQSSVQNASFLLMFQLLDKRLRVAFQSIVENIAVPLGIASAGALLLLFNQLTIDSTTVAMGLILLFAAIWLWLSRRLFSIYKIRLMGLLSRRILEGETLAIQDSTTLSLIAKKLESHIPGEVIYAVELLEQAQETAVIQAQLPRLLEHHSPEVRQEALRRTAVYGGATFKPRIKQMIENEQSPLLRGEAMRAYGKLASEVEQEFLVPYLHSDDAPVRLGALAGLHQNNSSADRQRVKQLLASSHPQERVLAAQLLGEVGIDPFAEQFVHLLQDDTISVQKAAIQAVHQTQDCRFYPHLIPALSDPLLRGTAVATLIDAGENALPTVGTALTDPTTKPQTLWYLLQICGRIGSPQAFTLLLPFYNHASRRLRHKCTEALSRCGYAPQFEAAHLPIHERIEQLTAQAHQLYGYALATAHHPATELLNNALRSDFAALKAQIFQNLSFLYDQSVILRAQNQLKLASKSQRDLALEALDITLSQAMKTHVLPILAQAFPQASPTLPPSDDSVKMICTQLLTEPLPDISRWSKVCALYALGRLKQPDTAPLLQKLSQHSNRLLAQTAQWSLCQLAQTAVKESTMLIPIEKVIILKTVDTFSKIPDDILAEIAKRTQELTIPAGTNLFEKGDFGDSMYIIISGEVRVHDGERTLNTLGDRTVFGEMAILDPAPRVASITAVTDTHLLQLQQDSLNELMQERFEVTQGIIRVLSQHLRARVEDINVLQKEVESLREL